jgi:hypothetical protein
LSLQQSKKGSKAKKAKVEEVPREPDEYDFMDEDMLIEEVHPCGSRALVVLHYID